MTTASSTPVANAANVDGAPESAEPSEASEYTQWTEADSNTFDQALMHPALAAGPLPEMVEGFITGTAVSPFDGLADELIAPLFSLFEIDLETLPPDAREPLIVILQKRLDAIMDGMDQTLMASVEGRAAVGLEPLLTDWDAAQSAIDEQESPLDPADPTTPAQTDTSLAAQPDLPKMAELWARGMQLAHLVWREDHWNRLDKHTRKDVDKVYQPINKLCADGKATVADSRLRANLLDDAINSAHVLYSMTQNYYDRLAVTPAPLVKAAVPGRNDPCACGSGKKYKKCCGT